MEWTMITSGLLWLIRGTQAPHLSSGVCTPFVLDYSRDRHRAAAVKTLRDAGIVVRSTSGLRTGLVIVDHEGYIFTPTALYLEADRRPTEAPNALRLSRDQVTEALARLSPAAKAIAIASAGTPAERDRIREQAVEVKSNVVADFHFAAVQEKLVEAPPVQFDVARQVRVFEPYLQYVELRLTGAAIHRHRIAIPELIQNLGPDESVQSRLKTTFDLIERESALSSKPIEDENSTRSGRTLRHLWERITAASF